MLTSLVCMLVPVTVLSFIMKGNVTRPIAKLGDKAFTKHSERYIMLVAGIAGLLFVPVSKVVTHYIC